MTSPPTMIHRSRGGAGEIETFAMANCLMLLSSQQQAGPGGSPYDPSGPVDPSRMFSCKTCGRKFPSFQALGGHRASHNKNKSLAGAGEVSPAPPAKPKTHACSICGLEFPIGQALGGHMRRHRAVLSGAGASGSTVTSEGSDGADVTKKRKIDADADGVVAAPAVLKKLNSGKRIYLGLDLNCSPWEKHIGDVDDHEEIEEGEIVEQAEIQVNKHEEEDESDFLKLELRQPIH